MSKSYSEQFVLSALLEKSEDMQDFYKQGFVNYKGKTSDTKKYYTEVIAEWLLDIRLDLLEQIPTITRENTYKIPSHNGVQSNGTSNRREEIIAKEMFLQKELAILGNVLDYQTPLKNKRSDCSGKIDLLSYDGKTLRLLELKKPEIKKNEKKETMLRCVLEGYTYLKIVDTKKLLKDFDLPPTTKILASPLVPFNGSQHIEMSEGRPYLTQLMKKLHVDPYYFSMSNSKYIITAE